MNYPTGPNIYFSEGTAGSTGATGATGSTGATGPVEDTGSSFLDSMREKTKSLLESVTFLDDFAIKVQGWFCMSKEDAFMLFWIFVLVLILVIYLKVKK